MIASMAYVHLLTDVGENALSVEDNFILSTIGSNGMARYGSAGLCKIIYPSEQIMQYCSMRWITELVDSYWMRIDKRFEEELILAREEQAMNPRIQLPGIIERYQEIFLEETSGEHASMASLYAQVFMQSDDGTDFSLADRFLEQIEELIEDATSKESSRTSGKNETTMTRHPQASPSTVPAGKEKIEPERPHPRYP